MAVTVLFSYILRALPSRKAWLRGTCDLGRSRRVQAMHDICILYWQCHVRTFHGTRNSGRNQFIDAYYSRIDKFRENTCHSRIDLGKHALFACSGRRDGCVDPTKEYSERSVTSYMTRVLQPMLSIHSTTIVNCFSRHDSLIRDFEL